jgi:hypothetical protein
MGGTAAFLNKATFTLQADMWVQPENTSSTARLTNAGTVTKTGGTGTSNIGVEVKNDGTLTASAGAFSFGTVTNNGTFSPSAIANPTRISGDFIQTSAGATLVVQLFLDTSGNCTLSNEIVVTGKASVGGTAAVVSKCTPSQFSYKVFHATSYSGQFSNFQRVGDNVPPRYMLDFDTPTQTYVIHQG